MCTDTDTYTHMQTHLQVSQWLLFCNILLLGRLAKLAIEVPTSTELCVIQWRNDEGGGRGGVGVVTAP